MSKLCKQGFKAAFGHTYIYFRKREVKQLELQFEITDRDLNKGTTI